MELRQLHYFLHVADLRSFSRAAVAVRIAQPALSRQIRKLESEVGVCLFHRDGRGAMLTNAGERYYAKIKVILRQLDEAKAELQGAQSVPTGEVVLGVPPQLGALFIAQTIQLFRVRYPTARIRVAEGFGFQVAAWLQTGRVDVGFVYDPPGNLVVEMMIEEALYLVGPPADCHATRETFPFSYIVGLPLVVPDLPSTLRARIEKSAARAGVTASFEIEVDSLPAIKQLILDGAGYTILPYAAVHDEVKRGQLSASRIIEPAIVRPLGLAVPAKGSLSLAAKLLILLIHEQVGDLIARGFWSGCVVTRDSTLRRAGLVPRSPGAVAR